MASNKEGKLRLCIDLSRWINDHCQTKKFRIESVEDSMKTVKKVSWLYSFDLKSAFHHVNISEAHQKYLGFQAVIERKKRLFKFRAMPFGYLDASRVITKVLRVPMHSWRLEGIPVFLRVSNSKEEAEEAVKVVKKDLKDLKELGLITSEAKCEWKPTQKITLCLFEWGTDLFRVRVTEQEQDQDSCQ